MSCQSAAGPGTEVSQAALAASADEGSAEASSAALAEEEDADSRMLRRFQKLCIRKGGRRGRKVPDFSHAIAARAVRLCNLAGRTEVYGDGPATLAWLSLAASFEGQPAEFMVRLHKGTQKEKQALMRACILAMNQIGGSSVFRS